VKAFDETFGQTVHQRYSYRYHDIIWGGKFTPAFGVDESGNLQVHLDKVGKYEIQNRL
jgi:inward rectifier potassium channel